MQVRFLDSRPGTGAVARELEFDSPRITLRELIRRRVADEVEQFNRDRPEIFEGLVQPDESEQILNGYRCRCPVTVLANLAKTVGTSGSAILASAAWSR
jgi:hypothetical protein